MCISVIYVVGAVFDKDEETVRPRARFAQERERERHFMRVIVQSAQGRFIILYTACGCVTRSEEKKVVKIAAWLACRVHAHAFLAAIWNWVCCISLEKSCDASPHPYWVRIVAGFELGMGMNRIIRLY